MITLAYKSIRLMVLLVGMLALMTQRAHAACPEPPESQTGLGQGLQKKDFLKALRHEVNLYGGLLMSDVMGKAPLAGISYAFHFNEDFALEASFAWAHFSSVVSKPISETTGLELLKAHDARMYLGSLLWDPFHGKFILFGSTIVHFDLFLRVGAGATELHVEEGLMGRVLTKSLDTVIEELTTIRNNNVGSGEGPVWGRGEEKRTAASRCAVTLIGHHWREQDHARPPERCNWRNGANGCLQGTRFVEEEKTSSK